MNLGKLLFAGKSVVNGSKGVEYRENKRVSLPKFASQKNHLAPKTTPGNHSAASANGSVPQPAASQPVPAVSSPRKFLPSWTGRLNPAPVWRGPRGEIQNATSQAVQTELSLDSVKVIHNDLTDADVEVVPIKSRAAVAVPDLPPAKKAWEFLGERLMRATAL